MNYVKYVLINLVCFLMLSCNVMMSMDTPKDVRDETREEIAARMQAAFTSPDGKRILGDVAEKCATTIEEAEAAIQRSQGLRNQVYQSGTYASAIERIRASAASRRADTLRRAAATLPTSVTGVLQSTDKPTSK